LAVRRVAPGASCGCAGASTPVTWRTDARAVALTAAGTVVGWHAVPVTTAASHPLAVAGTLALALAGYAVLSAELDRYWLRPLRRLRVELFGHPLALPDGPVPVGASVELLETSIAWKSAGHLVRSS